MSVDFNSFHRTIIEANIAKLAAEVNGSYFSVAFLFYAGGIFLLTYIYNVIAETAGGEGYVWV